MGTFAAKKKKIFIMVEFITKGFGHYIIAHKIYIFFQHNKG